MSLFSKRFITVPIILIISVSLVIFLYFYLNTRSTSPILEGVSKVHECEIPVDGEESASRCFNVYFENIRSSFEGEENVPDSTREMYRPIDEGEIRSIDGNFFIEREEGFGTPYYIDDSSIYFEYG